MDELIKQTEVQISIVLSQLSLLEVRESEVLLLDSLTRLLATLYGYRAHNNKTQ